MIYRERYARTASPIFWIEQTMPGSRVPSRRRTRLHLLSRKQIRKHRSPQEPPSSGAGLSIALAATTEDTDYSIHLFSQTREAGPETDDQHRYWRLVSWPL
jgi:hypothetical protein